MVILIKFDLFSIGFPVIGDTKYNFHTNKIDTKPLEEAKTAMGD